MLTAKPAYAALCLHDYIKTEVNFQENYRKALLGFAFNEFTATIMTAQFSFIIETIPDLRMPQRPNAAITHDLVSAIGYLNHLRRLYGRFLGRLLGGLRRIVFHGLYASLIFISKNIV